MSLRLSHEQRHRLKQIVKNGASTASHGFLLRNGTIYSGEKPSTDPNNAEQGVIGMYRASKDGVWTPTQADMLLLRQYNLDTLLVATLKGQQIWLKAWRVTLDDAYDLELLLPTQSNNPARLPLTSVQICAILVLMLLTLMIFLFVSFSLLPPASPIPTPRG